MALVFGCFVFAALFTSVLFVGTQPPPRIEICNEDVQLALNLISARVAIFKMLLAKMMGECLLYVFSRRCREKMLF
jgi:hypothetical protein